MKTILTSLPNLVLPDGYLEVTAVTYTRRECHLEFRLGEKEYLLVFPDAVAFRVMDERELTEFYSRNIEYSLLIQGSVVFLVEAGGWRGQNANLDSGIKDGYFGNGKVAEYLVPSDYECLSIISAAPELKEITHDTDR